MPQPHILLILADIAAIGLLVFGLYVPRYHRYDMVASYIGVNVGVLAIASVLTSVDASVGLGIGLFGVLSIIRLRSSELDQGEVAYYFVALVLGLLGGIRVDNWAYSAILMTGLLAVMWCGDHPRLLGRSRFQQVVLDRAISDERQLVAHLGVMSGASILRVAIRKIDYVNDTTLVDVCFSPGRTVATPSQDAPSPAFVTGMVSR